MIDAQVRGLVSFTRKVQFCINMTRTLSKCCKYVWNIKCDRQNSFALFLTISHQRDCFKHLAFTLAFSQEYLSITATIINKPKERISSPNYYVLIFTCFDDCRHKWSTARGGSRIYNGKRGGGYTNAKLYKRYVFVRMGKMFPTLPGVYQNGWVYQNVDGGPINPTISFTPTDLSMSNEISYVSDGRLLNKNVHMLETICVILTNLYQMKDKSRYKL